MVKHNLIWKIGDKVKITNEINVTDMSGRKLNGKIGTLLRFFDGRYHIQFDEFSKGDSIPMFRNQLSAPNWFGKLTSSEMRRLMKNEDNRKNSFFGKEKVKGSFGGENVTFSYSSTQAIEDGVLMKNPRQDNFPMCNILTTNLWKKIEILTFKRNMTRIFYLEPVEFLGMLMLHGNDIYVNKKFKGDNDKDFFVTEKTEEGLVVWFVTNEYGKLTAMLPEDY